jgi:3-oxoacid CoA-transferase subunit A
VRGNHEERPENISTMVKEWDSNVCGFVYMEHEFPLIRYFIDGETYLINGMRTLVLGGAYSVDKYYRLTFGRKWIKNEQLSTDEIEAISKKYKGDCFDLVLSHTCPRSWQPTDLFLDGIPQSTVDSSMEDWMEEFKEEISWNLYLFGHYHDDRFVRPHVEMLYTNIVNLQELYYRWNGEKKYILKNYNIDPKFFNEDNPWTKDYILLK